MPAISAGNLTNVRTKVATERLQLAVDIPASIWTARVNGAQADGATSIAVDGVVQVSAPEAEFRVLFGSTAGARDLGTARFRSYSAPTLTVSPHNSSLPDNAYVTILEYIKPDSKHPAMDDNDVVSEDGNVLYGSNLATQFPPLARIGCSGCATIDPDTGIATLAFWSDSVAMAPGATLDTHAWDFGDGVVQGTGLSTSAIAGTSGSPILVDYSTYGRRYVRYTVTDSNSKTGKRYEDVHIYDADHGPYTEIEIEDYGGERSSGGYHATIRVHGAATTTDFPSGAKVILYKDRWFDATKHAGIGNLAKRENIELVGYIRKGTVKKNWHSGYFEFQVESLAGVMGNLSQPGGWIETKGADNSYAWHVLEGLTYNLACYHVLQYHSTVPLIADVSLTLPSYTSESVELIEAPLAEQLRDLIKAVHGDIGCNAQGQLFLEPNPQLQALASRSTTYVLSTSLADWRDEVDLGEETEEKEVMVVELDAEDANGDLLSSIAPAVAWTTGTPERIDGVRAASQSEANTLAGLYEGYRNNQFKDVLLKWRGDYPIDIFPAEPVAVNLAANANVRGLSWSTQRCWTSRVSKEYRPGAGLLVDSVHEKDSYGSPGLTNDYSVDVPDTPVPEITVQPTPAEPPTPPPTTMSGDGSRLYLATDIGLVYTDNAQDVTPTWTAINTGLSGDGLDIYRFLFDPWSSDGSKLARAFLSTKGGFYRGTGLPAPAWTQTLSPAAVEATIHKSNGHTGSKLTRDIVLPINVNAAVTLICVEEATDNGNMICFVAFNSTDDGVTLTAMSVPNDNITGNILDDDVFSLLGALDGHHQATCFPSHTTAGTYWLISAAQRWYGSNSSPSYKIWKSTDRGVSWSCPDTVGWTPSAGNHPSFLAVIPFANNAGVPYANDSRAYRFHSGHGVEALQLLTAFPLEAGAANKGDAGMNHLWAVDLCTWNEDYVYALEGIDGSTGTQKVWSTNNGCTAWQSVDVGFVPTALSALPYNKDFCAVAGYLAGTGGQVKVSLDGGASFADKTGDLNTALPGITKVRSIVPDWIKT